MRPDPIDEEIQRRQWERFWTENPDADPFKIMCAVVCMVAVIGLIVWVLLLSIATLIWLYGIF